MGSNQWHSRLWLKSTQKYCTPHRRIIRCMLLYSVWYRIARFRPYIGSSECVSNVTRLLREVSTVLETRENFSHGASFLLKLGREITNSTVNSLVPSHRRTEYSNLREELAKLSSVTFLATCGAMGKTSRRTLQVCHAVSTSRIADPTVLGC